MRTPRISTKSQVIITLPWANNGISTSSLSFQSISILVFFFFGFSPGYPRFKIDFPMDASWSSWIVSWILPMDFPKTMNFPNLIASPRAKFAQDCPFIHTCASGLVPPLVAHSRICPCGNRAKIPGPSRCWPWGFRFATLTGLVFSTWLVPWQFDRFATPKKNPWA